MRIRILMALFLVIVMALGCFASCNNHDEWADDGTGAPADTDTNKDTSANTEPVLSKKKPAEIINENFKGVQWLNSSTTCKEAVLLDIANKNDVLDLFTAEDFDLLDVNKVEGAKFETFVLVKDKYMVTAYWNVNPGEMRIIWETSNVAEVLRPNAETGKGTITFAQIGTEREAETDNPLNGMCYVVKLSNGKAMVVDGGSGNKKTADNIFNTFKKMGISQNTNGKYEIEAWIFSHGHGDHTGGFRAFLPQYASSVSIKYIVYNFPGDDAVCVNGGDEKAFDSHWDTYLPSTKRITPHAGLKYYFGNVTLDMLYTPDMVYTAGTQMDYYNNSSIVFKLMGGGASVLMYGDAGENASEAMWKAYHSSAFKADILQVTHHALYTEASNGHGWTNLKNIYDATEATYAVLPMHARYTGETRNGRFTVLVQWTNTGYQVSYFTNKNDNHGDSSISQSEFDAFVESVIAGTNSYKTLYGYDGINKLVNANGLVTYTGGNNYNPMATVFGFSNGKVTVSLNQDLYEWLG